MSTTRYCCGRSMKIGQQKKAKAEAKHNAAIVKNSPTSLEVGIFVCLREALVAMVPAAGQSNVRGIRAD